jgi:hypothetical protein
LATTIELSVPVSGARHECVILTSTKAHFGISAEFIETV